jgi:hypothetical protein
MILLGPSFIAVMSFALLGPLAHFSAVHTGLNVLGHDKVHSLIDLLSTKPTWLEACPPLETDRKWDWMGLRGGSPVCPGSCIELTEIVP